MPLGAETFLGTQTPPPPPTGPHDPRYVGQPQHADLAQDAGQILAAGETAVAQYIATPGTTLGEKLTSRKLWAAGFGVLLSVLFAVLGAIPHAEALKSGTILGVAYIAAEGLVDALGALGLGG